MQNRNAQSFPELLAAIVVSFVTEPPTLLVRDRESSYIKQNVILLHM